MRARKPGRNGAASQLATRSGSRVHDPAAMAIGGDAMMFNRVKRLIGEVVERRTRAEVTGNGMAANSASLARSTWFDAGTEDSLDPRRSIWDECGYPSTRVMTPQRWQVLHDRNVVASTINEVNTRCCWQVKPSVYEKESGKVLTAFDKAYADLSMQLRSNGMPDYFGDDGGDPLTECWERVDGLCGIGRFGLVVYGLDDGLGWDKPVAGIEEAGSQPGEVELDEDGKPALDARGQPVFNVANRSSTPPRYEVTRDGSRMPRRLAYVNAFPESLVYPNRFETNRQSPRYGRPVSYRVTFVSPASAVTGAGMPLSTEQVHWTRCQHVTDWADTYDSSMVLAVPRCQVPLNNIMALDKLYHGGPEGFWKHCFPYLFLETHPQLGGDVEVDDEALKDMIEEMMNGLQKAGTLSGMAAKTVGGSVADPTSQVNLHLAAIAMKKRMPMRVLSGAVTGGLGSVGPAETEDDQWDDQVKKRQNGWVTSAIIRPSVNQLIWYGVLPPPQGSEKIKREWPDITKMSAERQAQVAASRAQAMSTYVNGGLGQIMSLFDFYVKELGMTEEDAKARIDAVIGEAQDTYAGQPEEQVPEQIADWVPPESTEGEGEDSPQAGDEPPNLTGNVWTEEDRLKYKKDPAAREAMVKATHASFKVETKHGGQSLPEVHQTKEHTVLTKSGKVAGVIRERNDVRPMTSGGGYDHVVTVEDHKGNKISSHSNFQDAKRSLAAHLVDKKLNKPVGDAKAHDATGQHAPPDFTGNEWTENCGGESSPSPQAEGESPDLTGNAWSDAAREAAAEARRARSGGDHAESIQLGKTGKGLGEKHSAPNYPNAPSQEQIDKFHEVSSRVFSDSGRYGATAVKTSSITGKREITAELGRDRKGSPTVKLDFAIVGEEPEHQAADLQPGSIDLAKKVKAAAQEYHKAGFQLKIEAREPRRKALYEKTLGRLGLKKVSEDGDKSVWNCLELVDEGGEQLGGQV